jgi:hypothetical protein
MRKERNRNSQPPPKKKNCTDWKHLHFVFILIFIFSGGKVYVACYLLEAALKGRVLLHVLAVLVQRGGADQPQLAARLEQKKENEKHLVSCHRPRPFFLLCFFFFFFFFSCVLTSIGLSRLAASIAPSVLPAPRTRCSSSMKTITPPCACLISFSTALSRSCIPEQKKKRTLTINLPEKERKKEEKVTTLSFPDSCHQNSFFFVFVYCLPLASNSPRYLAPATSAPMSRL